MTLASCAPEGTTNDFQIAAPEQRREAVTRRRAPQPLQVPSAARAPSLPASRPRPSRRARRVSITLAGLAPSGRRGQGTRRGDNAPTSPAARSSAPGHSRSARGDPAASARGSKSWGHRVAPGHRVALGSRAPRTSLGGCGTFPLGSRGLGKGVAGKGGKGHSPLSAALPSLLPRGPAGTAREEKGGDARKEGPRSARRARPGSLGDRGARIWGTRHVQTTSGCQAGLLHVEVGAGG